jgi:2-methylcitrate dehydratase PrpD
MTALEQLGILVARCDAPSRGLRALLSLHAIDTVGAWVAGLGTAEGAALLRWRHTAPSRGLGASGSLGIDVATHCGLARLSEIDDIHLASTTTPGAIVIPGAVTIGAAHGIRDPATLAGAMLAGYEVMVRLGRAIGGASILYRGIWPTYFAAPMGMAAVAARLAGLDARRTSHALALALVRSAPGVGHHNAATTSRWLAVGEAAAAGLTAARAAEAGFTSDLALLDGGFLPGVYDIRPEAAVFAEAPGAQSALDEVSFKPWCAARQTMAATQALREIIGSGVEAAAITRVRALVPPPHRRMVDHGVTIGDRGSFLTSLPYQLALAALVPDAAPDVGQAHTQVPDGIADFMARVTVEPDDALAGFPQMWPARVEVSVSSAGHARIVTQTVSHVPGDPARPFDAAAVREKFNRFAAPVLGEEAAGRIPDQVAGLLDGQTDSAQLLEDLARARSDLGGAKT